MTKENLLLFCGIILCSLFCAFFGVERAVEKRPAADPLVGEWLSKKSERWMQAEGSDRCAEYSESGGFLVVTFEKGGKGSLTGDLQKAADPIVWRYDDKTDTLTYRCVNDMDGKDIPCALTWIDDNVFVLTDRHEKPYVSRYVFQRVTTPRRPVVLP